MYSYTNNIPYYSNNMYPNYLDCNRNSCCSSIGRSYYNPKYQSGRIGPGGFLLPFGLGLLSAPLIYRPNYYPYPYYNNYPMYY